MKNLLRILVLAICLFPFAFNPASAQLLRTVTVTKDSTINATHLTTDFTTLTLPVDKTTISVTVTATRVSDTAAGKIYLEGNVTGSVWDGIDSLTITNAAAIQKTFAIPERLNYASYRIRYYAYGAKGKMKPIKAYVLRRQ